MSAMKDRLQMVREALAEAADHALNPLAVTPAKLNRWEEHWPQALAVLDQIIEQSEGREESRK